MYLGRSKLPRLDDGEEMFISGAGMDPVSARVRDRQKSDDWLRDASAEPFWRGISSIQCEIDVDHPG